MKFEETIDHMVLREKTFPTTTKKTMRKTVLTDSLCVTCEKNEL